MKPYHALTVIAIGLSVVLTQPQLTTAHGITGGNTIPPNATLAANTQDFLTQGNKKYQLGNYQGAIEDYTQALRLNPNSNKAYFNRGNTYAKLRNYSRAIEDFTQTIRLNPDDDKAYLHRGSAHSLAKDDQKAIEDFTQSIRLNPDDDRAYLSRGFSQSNLKDYQGAVEDFTQAIHLNPDSAEAYFGRGLAHALLRDDQKAIEDFNQTLKIRPDFAKARENRDRLEAEQNPLKVENRLKARDFTLQGNEKYDRKDYQGAIEDYTEAIRLDPDHTFSYFKRANANFRLKNYQEAIEDYNQCLRLKPNHADIYFLRGNTRVNLKDYQGAIEDYKQGLRIKPNDIAAKKVLNLLEAKSILSQYSATQRWQITLFISILLCFVWILSISLHEFGHAIVAYWGGDTSVKTKGYLTLNPLKYTHPLVSIILPALFFCLGAFPLPGAAVYIERHRLQNRWWQSAVSAAGPFTSFLVTLFLIALFQISLTANAPYWLSAALAFFISLHFFFVLFNLMPFPPLDGYGIIEVWLPQRLQVFLRKFALVGLIAICAVSFFPPFVRSIVGSAFTLTQLFGVPEVLPLAGFELFNRWYCALPLIAIGIFALIRKPQALWSILGELLEASQQFEWALKMYDRAIQVAPDDAQVWTRRGWLLVLAKSPQRSPTQRFATALQSFDRAIQLSPDYCHAWAGKGWTLYLLNRYNEAIIAYDRAIALEQNDYRVWSERGAVLASLRRYQEALVSFNQAIELRPDLDWLRHRRDLLLKALTQQVGGCK